MNNVTIIGQIEGAPQLIYSSKDGNKKLYKFVLRVPRWSKAKENTVVNDYINVKIWNSVLGDEDDYFDQAYIAIEGRLVSFGITDSQNYGNELVANKIMQLN
ncbi:single-stranded DNA-binding protein [Spiroplasma clarkii]|uniref:Single-strand DNA-binding protein n=1 Tax=Spiroplasma clarkii TaxID=2139 RepID=A0A1Y0L1V2_9MOLU|nr:single-stranded DNA-binding protein [Spiroplasma clarkii]ARU91981.1 single-stranded DNA-binding protein [Spiroplasma clarkii]ATX71319.1 single-strand DNA-binding protein [Spiroplasma clarkii]